MTTVLGRCSGDCSTVLSESCPKPAQTRAESENTTMAIGSQTALGIIALTAWLAVVLRTVPWRRQLRHAHIAWYVVTLFAVYALGAAWFMPITGNQSARLILVLFVPFLWTVGLVVPHATFPLVADQSSREAGEFLYSNDGTYEPFLNLRNLHDGHCTRGDSFRWLLTALTAHNPTAASCRQLPA